MTKLSTISACLLAVGCLTTSCDDFVFGNVHVNYDDNPLEAKPIARSGADHYVDSLMKIKTNDAMANPDPNGAFNNWSTCLAMFKEGHSHGDGKMHGNLGLCLYFFNKEGKLMNDDILNHSDEYQIFFTVSDVDDKGNPYDVMDCRGKWTYDPKSKDPLKKGTVDPTPIKAPAFANATTWKQRAELSSKLFEYTYRDTWTHGVMGDGARELFNQRLLPPLDKSAMDYAVAPYDQDRVGLKGHFNFDIDLGETDKDHVQWPYLIANRPDFVTGEPAQYTRPTYLLPKFYLSVRVMKCPKGKKALIPRDEYLKRHSTYQFVSQRICADATNPDEAKEYGQDSEWKEVLRFNIPIKIYCSSFDTDPTGVDPNDPLYYFMGREIGLTPEDALEAAQNVQTHGIGGGSGFGNWFL